MRSLLRFALVFFLLGIPRLGFAGFPQVLATNTSSEAADTTSHTVNLPSGIQKGDLLFVFFASDYDPAVILLAGWNLLPPASGVTCNAGNDVCGRFFYKIATGTEGATETVSTGNAQRSAHQTYRIGAWHGITAPEAVTATGSSAAADPADLVLSGWGALEDTLWLIMAVSDADTTFSADPANYTNALEVDSTGTTAGVKMRTLRRNLRAASENPGAFTNTNRGWVTLTVAIRPQAGAFGRRGFRGGP